MNLISSISKASYFQMNNLNLHLAYAKNNKSLIQLGPHNLWPYIQHVFILF